MDERAAVALRERIEQESPTRVVTLVFRAWRPGGEYYLAVTDEADSNYLPHFFVGKDERPLLDFNLAYHFVPWPAAGA